MNIKIIPTHLNGTVNIIPGKSLLHRYLICSYITSKKKGLDFSTLLNDLKPYTVFSNDAQTTMQALLDLESDQHQIECQDCGATARFVLPLACALGRNKLFACHGQLKNRPFNDIITTLESHGVSIKYSKNTDELFECTGQLRPDKFEISGSISSQFVSGLIMALSYFDKPSTISVKPPIVSLRYISLTLDALKKYGFDISCKPDITSTSNISKFSEKQELIINISGKQNFPHTLPTPEGDWSSAAFWYVANYLGNEVTVLGLNEASYQSDKKIVEILKSFSQDTDLDIDCTHIPDLVPALAVAATKRKHKTTLSNVKRLEYKESNRLIAITSNLDKIGVKTHISSLNDEKSLTIFPISNNRKKLNGNIVFESYNDHRIAMSNIILANNLSVSSTISGVECIGKSYYTFMTDYAIIGGKYE